MEARHSPDQRKAEPQDAAALISVLEEASSTYAEWAPAGWRGSGALPATQRDELPERLTRRDWWGRVAEAGGEAVGYVIVGPAVRDKDRETPIPGMLHLWHLFVRPAWWGSGVAADLLSAALGEAAQRVRHIESAMRT
jgi:GNAT superfamily N-acetyltransferase